MASSPTSSASPPAAPKRRRSAAAPVGPAENATGLVPFEPTHYQCLGLAEDCTAAEVDLAWHRLVHARPVGSAEMAADQRLAHAVLSDPARRLVYDRWLAIERAALAPPPVSWLARLTGRGKPADQG